MSNLPKVSVIMSVCNGARYLCEAVESILTQTFTDFEFIIIDDGSTDETWAILSEYDDPRIHLVQNEQNIGLTRSLNKGLALARGEYIARMDADDVSLPERLEKQVDFLDVHHEIGLLGTAYEIISSSGKVLERLPVITDNLTLQQRLREGNCFVHGSAMLPRIALETVGYYDIHLETAQDYDLWLRIADRFAVGNLTEHLYRLRFHWRSISTTRMNVQITTAILIREKHNLPSVTQEGVTQLEDVGNVNLRTLGIGYLWWLYLAYLSDDMINVRSLLMKMLATLEAIEPVFLSDEYINYAVRVSEHAQVYTAGAIFINQTLSIRKGHPQEKLMRCVRNKALGKYYVTSMFSSYAHHDFAIARRCLVLGLFHDWRWLQNRGVVSVGFECIVGEVIAGWVRRIIRT